jgi:signal peptidase I
LFWSLALPIAAALLVMRHLVPVRAEGQPGGLLAWSGDFADRHPLIVGLALFIGLSETARYWRKRLRHGGDARAQTSAFDARATWRLVAGLLVVFVAALAFRYFFIETYRVIGGSMLPTLKAGDRLLVDKLAYVRKKLPLRGDVVVFDAGAFAGEGQPSALVKRVIGLPGDRVSFQGGHAIVNDWPVPSCDAGPFAGPVGKQILRGRLAVERLEDQTYLTVVPVAQPPSPDFVVPPGQVYVVGDDRSASSDSRNWNNQRGGGVPVSAIRGKVTRILAGFNRGDGKLDLSRLVAPLAAQIREPSLNLAQTDKWIAGCFKTPPAATRPPAPLSR